MKRSTILLLLTSLLFCSCIPTDKEPQANTDIKIEDTQVNISSEEMNGVWRWNVWRVIIQNGEIYKDQSYGNSPADPEEENASYLKFENGKILAHYTYFIFYEKEGIWGEYVIDNNTDGLLINFDKETKKGHLKNLSGRNGELTVLKSDNDRIELLIDLGNDSYSVLELNHETNTDLIQKLKTCPNRDYNQMRRDREEYWKQKN